MNWPRVKWLLIAMLLLGNLLLAALYLRRRAEVRSQAGQFQGTLLATLSDQGVTLAPGVESQLFVVTRRLYAPRDIERESALAAALLGQVERSDLGGRIYEYTGAAGRARFWGGGQFELEWTEPRVVSGSVEADGAALLLEAGFPADPPPIAKREPGATTLTQFQVFDGLPVLDTSVDLRYQGQTAISLSGQWLWGNPLPAEGQASGPVLGATLLRFIGNQRQAGTPVSLITGAQPGYVLSTHSPEYLCLTPVWRITADSREVYIDAETGEQLTVDN